MRHNSLAIGLRLFLQPRCCANGTWHHIVGISLCLIFGTFALLSGLQDIVKCSLNLFGRTNTALLQVDAHHFNAHLVTVQNVLHQGSNSRGNLIAFFCQSRIHFHFAHHLTHGRFSSLHHGFCGVFAFKQIGPSIVQSVLNGKFNFNNVFIFCEHGRLTQARGFDDVVAANVNRSNLGDKHQLVLLNGVRKAPIETCANRGFVFSKLSNDGLLSLLDNEETRPQPNENQGTQNDTNA